MVDSLQRAIPGRREVPGDPPHAGAISPVRRESDVDDRVVEAGYPRERRAERRVLRQLDDSFVLVGETELPLRDEHAVAPDAADLRLLQNAPPSGPGAAGVRVHAHPAA